MIRISKNNLINITRHEEGINKLAFAEQSGLPFLMDSLTARVVDGTYSDLMKDFENDINKTTDLLEKLKIMFDLSDKNNVVEGIDLSELFEINGVNIHCLGIQITKGAAGLSRSEMKEKIIRDSLGFHVEKYKDVLKIAKTQGADEITLPFNPTEKEKMVYLMLKTKEGDLYEFANKVNKKLDLYRQMRSEYEPEELNLIDSKMHGFKRTMADGVLQTSTYITANEVKQISTKHQKDIGCSNKIKKLQKIMESTGIFAVEIDSDDDLDKVLNLADQAKDFTLNTKSRFFLKTRKLGNYGGKDFSLFGMYFPASDIIAFDSRDPSALAHEYAHAIDYKNNFVSEKMRNSFIGVMKAQLDKQYYTDVTLSEYASVYMALERNPEFVVRYFDMIGKEGLEVSEVSDRHIEKLSKTLADKNKRNQAIRSVKEIDDIEGKKALRDLFAEFDTMVSDDGFDFVEKINYLKARGRNNYEGGSYSNLAKLILNNDLEFKENEGFINTPSDYHYLSKGVEVIARAGEIGYLLSKYGYEGHNSQEELDEWINKVSIMQDKEAEQFKSIRGTHHIKTYLEQSEAYFGFDTMSQESLMALKGYYKPFFQPKNIYQLDNKGDLELIQNTTSLDPVDSVYLRKLFENMATIEFENSKKKKEQRRLFRRKKEKRSFDKNKYPISYLKDSDDVERMFNVNQAEDLFDGADLLFYVMKNIDDLGRTTLKNDFDIDKLNEKTKVFAKLVANRDAYDGVLQKAINYLESGAQIHKKNAVFKDLRKELKGEDNIYGHIFVKSPMVLNVTSGGLSIPVEKDMVRLGRENRNSLEGVEANFKSFRESVKEYRTLAEKERDILRDMQAYQSLSAIKSKLDRDGIEEDFGTMANRIIDNISNAMTSEEVLINYFTALSTVTDLVNLNGEDLKSVYEPDTNVDIGVSKGVIEYVRNKMDNFDDNDLIHFNNLYIERVIHNGRYKTREPLMLKDRELGFDLLNLEGKKELLSFIIDKERADESLLSAKSHKPTDKIIKKYEDGGIDSLTEKEINKYFSNKKINQLLGRANNYGGNFISPFLEIMSKKENIEIESFREMMVDTPRFLVDSYRKDLILQYNEDLPNEKEIGIMEQVGNNLSLEDFDSEYEDENMNNSVSRFKSEVEMLSLFDLKPDDYRQGDELKEKMVSRMVVENYIKSEPVNEVYQESKQAINDAVYNSFIKPIDEAMRSSQPDAAEYVYGKIHDIGNKPTVDVSDKNIKKMALTYLSVLQQQGITDEPFKCLKGLDSGIDELGKKRKIKI